MFKIVVKKYIKSIIAGDLWGVVRSVINRAPWWHVDFDRSNIYYAILVEGHLYSDYFCQIIIF